MIDFLARRSVWILGTAFLFAFIAVPFALRLEMTTELVQLLPQDLPSVKSFRQFEEQVGGHTFLSVVIESPDRLANERFGDALAQRLAAMDWATQVHFRRDVDFMLKRWPFLLPQRDLEQLEFGLREAAERARIEHSPLAIDLDDEPAEPDWDRLRSIAAVKELRSSADGTVVLIQVQMRKLTSRIKQTETILAEADSDIQALQPSLFHPDLKARLYGGLRFRIEEYNSIRQDLARASLITLPLILLIPALALRSCWQPLVVLIPVGIGMAWTYGTAYFLFGSLNLVSCFLFLILFGIGDDFPIHLLYRVREEIGNGAEIRDATASAVRATMPPLVFSALTGLAGFISLAWMHFRGFSQFGIIAGMGVCLILAATIVTVPGIVWLIRSRLGSGDPQRSEMFSGGKHLTTWRSAAPVFCLWAILAGVSTWIVYNRLEFESDFENLRPTFTELRELRGKAESIEGFQKSSPAVFFTTDFEASREITRTLQARLDREGAQSPIQRVISLASILDGDTPARRMCLQRILEILNEPFLRRAPADVSAEIERLRRHLDLSPLTLESIPIQIRRSLTGRTKAADGTERELYLVVAEPRERISLAPQAQAFAQRLEDIRFRGQQFVAAGEALIFAEILGLVKHEGWVVIAFAWLATGALVVLAFRSWADLIALLVTLAGSIAITLAILAFLGMRLSFFNLTVLPLLIGLGINYGIHILHRYHEEGITATHAAGNLAASVGSAAVTTLVGFAGLLLARHPGLWSMGLAATLGIGVIASSCLLFLPSMVDLLAFLRRGR